MATFSSLFTAAQTNTVLVTVQNNERLTLTRLEVYCDNGNDGDVGWTIQFETGDVFAGHPGVAAGSGTNTAYVPGVIEGPLGKDLLFTCEAASAGIRVSGSYYRYFF